MEDIIIKNLQDCRNHIHLLAKWYYEEWGHLKERNTPQRIANRITNNLNCRTSEEICEYFVALSGKELIGGAAIKEQDMHGYEHLRPWVSSVYVKPEERGNGIGSALITRLREEATHIQGIEKLYLYTPDAQDFYLRQGAITMRDNIPYKDMNVSILYFDV